VPYYLGLDCSTQSLTAAVIEGDPARPHEWSFAAERVVKFDDLPFDSSHGVIPDDEPLIAHASPIMWAAGLEMVMGRLARHGLDVKSIAAVSGAAQQHGSVYLNADADRALATMAIAAPIFSRRTSPIWMDASTTTECREIEAAAGGAAMLAQHTGSRAFERFTAAQIRKFWKEDPAAYERTSRIHLVSSYLASLLIGRHAPLDPGDASGMNLMDLTASDWWQPAVDACAPDLTRRLPRIVASHSVIGALSRFWQDRFGYPPAAVIAWTGDNPSSLIGSGLVREGQLAISLGTSDTIFGPMREPRVSVTGEGHVFGAPTGEFMAITVFSNGSLAREQVRDMFALDWKRFSEVLRETPAGNQGRMLLPWFEPEITPRVTTPGIARHELDEGDAPGHVRAVVEAQMMAMKRHSQWMGVTPSSIRATGGAAANDAILQVMADVFGVPVTRAAESNTSALGAALRALHGAAAASGQPLEWDAIVERLDQDTAVIRPDERAHAIYQELIPRYAAFEARVKDTR